MKVAYYRHAFVEICAGLLFPMSVLCRNVGTSLSDAGSVACDIEKVTRIEGGGERRGGGGGGVIPRYKINGQILIGGCMYVVIMVTILAGVFNCVMDGKVCGGKLCVEGVSNPYQPSAHTSPPTHNAFPSCFHLLYIYNTMYLKFGTCLNSGHSYSVRYLEFRTQFQHSVQDNLTVSCFCINFSTTLHLP